MRFFLLLLQLGISAATTVLYQLETRASIDRLVVQQAEFTELASLSSSLAQGWRSLYVVVDKEPEFISVLSSLRASNVVRSAKGLDIEITQEDDGFDPSPEKLQLRLQKRSIGQAGSLSARALQEEQPPLFDFANEQYLSPALLMAFISVGFVLLIGFGGMSMLLSIQTPTVFEKPMKVKKQ